MPRFWSLLAPATLTFALVGCSESTTTTAPEQPATQEPTASTPAPQATGSGSVQIQTGGAGGLAPVTGTENLQGGSGGGVGQAAKSQAQKAAAGAGGSSLDQLGDE